MLLSAPPSSSSLISPAIRGETIERSWEASRWMEILRQQWNNDAYFFFWLNMRTHLKGYCRFLKIWFIILMHSRINFQVFWVNRSRCITWAIHVHLGIQVLVLKLTPSPTVLWFEFYIVQFRSRHIISENGWSFSLRLEKFLLVFCTALGVMWSKVLFRKSSASILVNLRVIS